MGGALAFGVLIVHRFAIGVCFGLGLLCMALYSLAVGGRPVVAIERSAFRPVTFALAALGFLALDLGVIWIIMQIAWR